MVNARRTASLAVLILLGAGVLALLQAASAEAATTYYCNGKRATVVGTAAADELWGNLNAPDVIVGLGGNDTIYGAGGDDTICGGDGDDTISALSWVTTNTVWIDGGAGADSITTGTSAETIYGGAGNDTINGGDNADAVYGDAGDDTINGEAGNDTINAGDGYNLVHGGAGDDVISAGGNDDRLYGDDGADRLSSGDGENWLYGGSGNDVVIGGNGVDDWIFTEAGDDTVVAQAGDDLVWLGDGNDFADLGDGNDSAFGGTGVDELRGMAGNDTLDGMEDDDRLVGNDGNDTMAGSAGNDRFGGGNGNDTMRGDDGSDVMDGGEGNDTISGGAGNDNVYGGSGRGADTLSGDAGDDLVAGGLGGDEVRGNDGNDRVYGDEADDVNQYVTDATGWTDGVFGGNGDDLVAGTTIKGAVNQGAMVWGGPGNDRFQGGLNCVGTAAELPAAGPCGRKHLTQVATPNGYLLASTNRFLVPPLPSGVSRVRMAFNSLVLADQPTFAPTYAGDGSATFAMSLGNIEGARTVSIQYLATNGEWSDAVSQTMVQDTRGPAVALDAPPDGSTVRAPFLVRSTVMDPPPPGQTAMCTATACNPSGSAGTATVLLGAQSRSYTASSCTGRPPTCAFWMSVAAPTSGRYTYVFEHKDVVGNATRVQRTYDVVVPPLPGGPGATVADDVILQPGAVILDAGQRAGVMAFSVGADGRGSARVSAQLSADWVQIGRTLVTDVIPGIAPDGVLARIVGVADNGDGTLTLTTGVTDLTDVFAQLSTHITVWRRPGVQNKILINTGKDPVEFQISGKMFDLGPGLKVGLDDTKFTLGLDLDIDIRTEWSGLFPVTHLDRFSVTPNFEATTALKLSMESDLPGLTAKAEKDFCALVPAVRVTFGVGPVPVVLVGSLGCSVEVSGTIASGRGSMRMPVVAWAGGTATYDGTRTTSDISWGMRADLPEFEASLKATATVYPNVSLDVMLYGFLGPRLAYGEEFAGEIGVTFRPDPPPGSHEACLKVTADAKAKVSFRIGNRGDVLYETDPFEISSGNPTQLVEKCVPDHPDYLTMIENRTGTTFTAITATYQTKSEPWDHTISSGTLSDGAIKTFVTGECEQVSKITLGVTRGDGTTKNVGIAVDPKGCRSWFTPKTFVLQVTNGTNLPWENLEVTSDHSDSLPWTDRWTSVSPGMIIRPRLDWCATLTSVTARYSIYGVWTNLPITIDRITCTASVTGYSIPPAPGRYVVRLANPSYGRVLVSGTTADGRSFGPFWIEPLPANPYFVDLDVGVCTADHHLVGTFQVNVQDGVFTTPYPYSYPITLSNYLDPTGGFAGNPCETVVWTLHR